MSLLQINRLIKRIIEELDSEFVSASAIHLASEFADLKRSVKNRLDQVIELKNISGNYQAMQASQIFPALPDLIEKVSFSRCVQWEELCRGLDFEIPPQINQRDVENLESLYENSSQLEDEMFAQFRASILKKDDKLALYYLRILDKIKPQDEDVSSQIKMVEERLFSIKYKQAKSYISSSQEALALEIIDEIENFSSNLIFDLDLWKELENYRFNAQKKLAISEINVAVLKAYKSYKQLDFNECLKDYSSALSLIENFKLDYSLFDNFVEIKNYIDEKLWEKNKQESLDLINKNAKNLIDKAKNSKKFNSSLYGGLIAMKKVFVDEQIENPLFQEILSLIKIQEKKRRINIIFTKVKMASICAFFIFLGVLLFNYFNDKIDNRNFNRQFEKIDVLLSEEDFDNNIKFLEKKYKLIYDKNVDLVSIKKQKNKELNLIRKNAGKIVKILIEDIENIPYDTKQYYLLKNRIDTFLEGARQINYDNNAINKLFEEKFSSAKDYFSSSNEALLLEIEDLLNTNNIFDLNLINKNIVLAENKIEVLKDFSSKNSQNLFPLKDASYNRLLALENLKNNIKRDIKIYEDFKSNAKSARSLNDYLSILKEISSLQNISNDFNNQFNQILDFNYSNLAKLLMPSINGDSFDNVSSYGKISLLDNEKFYSLLMPANINDIYKVKIVKKKEYYEDFVLLKEIISEDFIYTKSKPSSEFKEAIPLSREILKANVYKGKGVFETDLFVLNIFKSSYTNIKSEGFYASQIDLTNESNFAKKLKFALLNSKSQLKFSMIEALELVLKSDNNLILTEEISPSFRAFLALSIIKIMQENPDCSGFSYSKSLQNFYEELCFVLGDDISSTTWIDCEKQYNQKYKEIFDAYNNIDFKEQIYENLLLIKLLKNDNIKFAGFAFSDGNLCIFNDDKYLMFGLSKYFSDKIEFIDGSEISNIKAFSPIFKLAIEDDFMQKLKQKYDFAK